MPSLSGAIDRKALSAVFKDPRTLLAFEEFMKVAGEAADGVLASFLLPSLTSYFGGVGDGVTSNDTAFTDAEASDFTDIYIPAGEYLTTLGREALTKHYFGPGKIIMTGYALPGRFSYIAEPPTLWPTQGNAGFFRGDTSAVDPEWRVIGPGSRLSLEARYFEAPFIPKPVWHEVFSGASGKLSASTGPLVIGATSATLVSVDGLAIGGTYGLSATGMDGTILDTITVSNIVGAVIDFTPALANNYPTVATVISGKRTWGGVRYTRVLSQAPLEDGDGGGDVYGDIVRMVQRFTPYAGQTHIFEGSTVGQFGGDVFFEAGAGGTMATGWESQYNDQGEDVAVFAQIDSFNRNNDTGARSAVWLGSYFKSEGAVPADVAHVVSGKWRAAVDTVQADLTEFNTPFDFGNVAINTALGHRWVMNSTASTAGRGGSTLWGAFYGNTLGDMFIESGTDGTSDYIALRFGRVAPNDARFRIRPDGFQFNKSIALTGSLICTGDLVAGPGGLISTNGIGSGDYCLANAGLSRWEFYIGGVMVGTVP